MVYYRQNNDYLYKSCAFGVEKHNSKKNSLSKKKAGNNRLTNDIIILKLTNVGKRILLTFFQGIEKVLDSLTLELIQTTVKIISD